MKRQQSSIFKVLKEKKMANIQFYTQQEYISKNEGKIKSFSNVQKLNEFILGTPTLLEMQRKERLKQVIQKENYTRLKYKCTQRNEEH